MQSSVASVLQSSSVDSSLGEEEYRTEHGAKGVPRRLVRKSSVGMEERMKVLQVGIALRLQIVQYVKTLFHLV